MLLRDDHPPPGGPAEAYDTFWTVAEADLDTPVKAEGPPADPADTYAAFHAAAGE